MIKKENLTIGEVAKRSQVSVATLRFYEEKNMITSIRTNGNQRRYSRSILRRIAIIKVAQQVGMSLAEIQEALHVLPKDKKATKQDWDILLAQWENKLDEQLKAIFLLKQKMSWCIGCGCLSLKECPLRNPNDIMARNPKKIMPLSQQYELF